MIDPITALTAATTAFNVIKKGFEVGRDVESMYSDIGRWMSAVSDIEKAHDLAKNPPLFKKITFSKSIEEEAMQAWQAKIKAKEMRDELRALISFMRGPQAWDDLVRMEVSIRKERQEAIHNQKQRQKAFFELVMIITAIAVSTGLLVWFVYFLINYRGV